MNKLQQIERLHQLFTTRRRRLSLDDLSADLNIAPGQCKGLLSLMIEHLDSPIECCQTTQTYAYPDEACGRYKLPKCWLNPDEFLHLVALDHQLQCQPKGLLQEDLQEMPAAISAGLRKRKLSQHQFERRIKYLSDDVSYHFPDFFSAICAGLLERRQLAVCYFDDDGQTHELNVCPQLLLHRNGRWLLTAWCHLSRQLRCLEVAQIDSVNLLGERAREIAPKNVEVFLGNQFGYNQKQPLTLHLSFTGRSAYQVARQTWHPDQQGQWQGGQYHLRLPLVDQERLLGQVLVHLPNVQVLQPTQFADQLTGLLQRALARQTQDPTGQQSPANAQKAILATATDRRDESIADAEEAVTLKKAQA